MNPQDKAVTALVRSMKKALASEHGVKIPHSALRASYLSALGENPHAFAGKHADAGTGFAPAPASAPALLKELKVLRELVAQAPEFFAPQYDFGGAKLTWLERAGLVQSQQDASTASTAANPNVDRVLYLAADDIGCLDRMSLDAAGKYCLPEDWAFAADCQLCEQHAQVPSVRRYGLPQYLATPSEFYRERFSLKLAERYSATHEDLGDDSGDSCTVTVAMLDSQWWNLVLAVLADNQDLRNDVAEWVGLHYGRNFDTLAMAQRVDYVERYLEASQDEVHAEDSVPELVFDWVYPDEDGDNCPATLDLDTGIVTPSVSVPDDLDNKSVRTRILVESLSDEPFEVYFKKNDKGGHWVLRKNALAELKQLLADGA